MEFIYRVRTNSAWTVDIFFTVKDGGKNSKETALLFSCFITFILTL